jgi:peptidoglycan/LPS O-acetylase OafA/YrhL
MNAFYRSEINGLRAISVLAVIFFHAGLDLFKGGFVGVDIFFVISGFLFSQTITDKKIEISNSNIWIFYEKRARRILPAYLALLLLISPLALYLLLPSDGIAYIKSLLAGIFFSSNLLFWREIGYFDRAVELKPLLHTWSLGVEAQFYLALPFLLSARLSRRFLFAILLLSFLLCLFSAYKFPVANFYLLPTRIWEFLFGSFCGYYYLQGNNYIKSQLKDILALLGILIILLTFIFYDERFIIFYYINVV